MSFKKLARVSDIVSGKIHSISTKYVQVGITKVKEEIVAFEDVCSHDGEKISTGKVENDTVVCPRHFAKFDLCSGKPLCMPATEPISIFSVQIQGEDVLVDIED